MSRFTSGHLIVYPMRITTSASLGQIAAALKEIPYEGLGTSGWGSFGDDVSLIGKPTRLRPETGQPLILEARQEIPDRVAARLYYEETDVPRAKFATGDDLLDYKILRAVDLLISQTATNEFLALAGASQSAAATVKVALQDALEGIAPTTVEIDSSQLELGDPDIFRWLLYRWKVNAALDSMTMTAFEAIDTSENAGSRRSSLTGGAEFDRPELLALLGQNPVYFGPARIAVNYHELQLTADFTLRLNGGFHLVATGSGYANPRSLSTAEITRRMIEDTAYRIIPDLREAHTSDQQWREDRVAFVQQARSDLVKGVASALEFDICPVCGKTN